jgi:hypothetical protein
MTNNHLDALRRVLLRSGSIEIDAISGAVFDGISVDTAITIRAKASAGTAHEVRLGNTVTDGTRLMQRASKVVRSSEIEQSQHALLTGATSQAERGLLERLEAASVRLGQIADVNFGKQLRDRKTFNTDVIECTTRANVPLTHRACLTGRDVTRYHLEWGGLACLANEVARRGGCWDESRHAGKRKLLTRQIGRYPTFAMDDEGLDCLNTIFMVNVSNAAYSPSYVLGCLNSAAVRFYWSNRFYDQRDTFPKIKGTYLKLLPIPRAIPRLRGHTRHGWPWNRTAQGRHRGRRCERGLGPKACAYGKRGSGGRGGALRAASGKAANGYVPVCDLGFRPLCPTRTGTLI